jgi:diguanylate cyclase (GGDEF)-like protein
MPEVRAKRRAGQGRDAVMRRHTRSLLVLAQRLWQSGSALEPALTAITETAASVLEVERVKVWHFEPGDQLRCVHSYERTPNAHNVAGFDERLQLPGQVPVRTFLRPRVTRCDELDERRQLAELADPLARYLRQHSIRSLLDAPIRVDGELYGMVCHEHVGPQREWRRDELAFAGRIGEIVAVALEIERRKRAEMRLEFLELHDPVTGLANRALFHGALQDLLRRQRRKPRLAALLFIDLDHFYSVNESVGEVGGDVVLAELGERINGATPDDAVIARVESDCFAVLLPRIPQEWQAVKHADDVLASLAQPLRLDGKEFSVGASIGIAFNHGDPPTTSDVWLRDADLASKQARQLGRNRCEIFDPDRHRGLLDRLRVEHGLRESLRNGSLAVAYQPEIELGSGHVIGAEALLRWRGEDGTLRVAGQFIDVAESSGLIVPIGRWVLHRACSDARSWPPTAAGRVCPVAVNLSARQFEQPGLVEMVTEVLAETGFDPKDLCLEITESALMSHAQSALETLHALKALGVSLAVDDFGTGYSSLAYLKRFPVDVLKIDKTMIDGLPADPHACVIVAAVLGLARAIGLDVVVEGVELEAQAEELRRMGCRRVQGWLYARGEPCADFAARLQRDAAGADTATEGGTAPGSLRG